MGNTINIAKEHVTLRRAWSFVDGTTVGLEEFPLVCYVIQTNQYAIFKVLVDRCFNFHIVDKFGNTPLHYAVKQLDDRYVDNLMKLGLNTCVQNKVGTTPLIASVRCNILKYIRCLSDSMFMRDNKQMGAIHYAVTSGNEDMVKELLYYTKELPTTWVCTNVLYSPVDYHVNYFTFDNMSVFAHAVNNMDFNMCRLLLEHGGDMHAGEDTSALSILLKKYKSHKRETILKLWALISKDTDVHKNIHDGDKYTGLLTGEYKFI